MDREIIIGFYDSKWRKRRDLTTFLNTLKERGLQGTELAISDAQS